MQRICVVQDMEDYYSPNEDDTMRYKIVKGEKYDQHWHVAHLMISVSSENFAYAAIEKHMTFTKDKYIIGYVEDIINKTQEILKPFVITQGEKLIMQRESFTSPEAFRYMAKVLSKIKFPNYRSEDYQTKLNLIFERMGRYENEMYSYIFHALVKTNFKKMIREIGKIEDRLDISCCILPPVKIEIQSPSRESLDKVRGFIDKYAPHYQDWIKYINEPFIEIIPACGVEEEDQI